MPTEDQILLKDIVLNHKYRLTMAKTPKSKKSQFALAVDRLEKISVKEFKKKLLSLGIITEAGDLTAKYKQPARPKKKVAKKSSTDEKDEFN